MRAVVSLVAGCPEKVVITLNTVVSERRTDFRCISEKSLMVIDGLSRKIRKREKSRRNLRHMACSREVIPFPKMGKLGMFTDIFLRVEETMMGKNLVGWCFDSFSYEV